MKRTLLAGLLLLTYNCHAQKKKTAAPHKVTLLASQKVLKEGELPPGTIMGLGPFKIGVTRLDSLPLVLNMPIYIDSSTKSLKAGSIYDLRDHVNADGIYKTLYVDYRKQFIDGYSIVEIPRYKYEDLDMGDVKLVFKDGILIYFHCDATTGVNEILKLKYGKGAIESQIDTVYCRSTLTGVVTPYEQSLISQTWTAGGVSADLFTYKNYDEKCKVYYLSGTTIEDKAKSKAYHKQVEEREKELEKRDMSKY